MNPLLVGPVTAVLLSLTACVVHHNGSHPHRSAQPAGPVYTAPAPTPVSVRRAPPVVQTSSIFAVKQGLYCDREVRTCYNRTGAAPDRTKEQFGHAARQELKDRLHAPAGSGREIYRSGRHVTCDRLSQVCYDADGANLDVTHTEFGRHAARRLAQRLQVVWVVPDPAPRRPVAVSKPTATAVVPAKPAPVADGIFRVKRGLYCDRTVRSCYNRKGAALERTREQFGTAAKQKLKQRIAKDADSSRGIYRSGKGVACDRLSRVCYDVDGPNLTVTRVEFGPQAERKLARRIR